jgi:hypothetical protein
MTAAWPEQLAGTGVDQEPVLAGVQKVDVDGQV